MRYCSRAYCTAYFAAYGCGIGFTLTAGYTPRPACPNRGLPAQNVAKAKGNLSVSGVNKIIVAYISATLLVALAAVASLWTFNKIDSASNAHKDIAALIFRADTLLDKLGNAETNARGFALTGDGSFLQSHLLAVDGVLEQLKELRSRTHIKPAIERLDTLALLLNNGLTHLSDMIELRRRQDLSAVISSASNDRVKQTMDSIQAEVRAYVKIETVELKRQQANFDSAMRWMFVIIVGICLLALLLAVVFAYLAYRETQHRLKALVHQETQHLLGIQESINKQLQLTNFNLHISEERLAVTLNSIDDAVIATDAEGRVTLLNPLAERLTGWTRVDAFQRPVEDIFHLINADTRLPYVVPMRETLEHGTTLGLANHTIVIARDGTETHIADSCAPILDRKGRVVGAVLVFRDVTERKHLDQILHEKNAALERATAIAEKANLAKSEFLSSMSHELRTPLSAILGFAQLIDSGTPTPAVSQKRSLDQILKAGWYLLDLINEILDLALIESGKLSLSMEPVLLSDVMRECHAMIEPQAEKRSTNVIFSSVAGECQVYVMADRTRMKQVLINLLSNAIKYNSADGKVYVDCIADVAGRVRVCVRDSGAGLSPEQIAQLFQPFNRLGREESAEQGTGIGLVMSKKLIELMGGTIGVESTVGQGCLFWVELNRADEPQPIAAGLLDSITRVPDQNSGHLRTLLYVEDNPANLMLVEDLIARQPDIHLLSARDGISGVKTALDSLPDVILMDINLPGISGVQAMQIIKSNPATAHIPVVALSANAMPRDIEKGLEAGFFRYLTKPIKVNEFMDALDTAFAFAKAQSAGSNQKAKT
jgi:PAS domain S-box-containing protein